MSGMAGASSSAHDMHPYARQYVPVTACMEFIEPDDSGEKGHAVCGNISSRRVTKEKIEENWKRAKADCGFVWSREENMALCPGCSPHMSMQKFDHLWTRRQPGAFKPMANPPPTGFENSPSVSPSPSARGVGTDDRINQLEERVASLEEQVAWLQGELGRLSAQVVVPGVVLGQHHT